MRSIWILNIALLIAAVGCSLPGNQKTAFQPNASKTSWTDKMTAPFAALSPKNNPKPASGPVAVDPISLAAGTGPPTAALYVSMAQLSDQGHNSAHARDMYRRALELDPKNIDALLGIARLEDREGNLQVALQYYQQAVDNHPQDARPLNDLGLCHARCGQMQRSLQCLDRAVRLRPEKPLYRNNIAKVLIEVDQFDSAMAHLGAVYEPAVANYNMAALLNERNRGDEAIPFLHRALAAKPQLSEASTLLANLTGVEPALQQARVSDEAPAQSSPITVSAPIATVNPLVTQPMVAQPMVTQTASGQIEGSTVDNAPANSNAPSPYVPGNTQTVSFSYPATGAPPMIPVPAQTARVPVGYEPALLPPIR